MSAASNILVTGGTGFIGTHLCKFLIEQEHDVTVLSRRPPASGDDPHRGRVSYVSSLGELNPDNQWFAVINLAGEPLNSGRWNNERKAKFRGSRIDLTRSLIQWMQSLANPPTVFLSGSAIGWYGHWEDEALDENSTAHGGFAHELCRDWESAAMEGAPQGTRVCCIRIGLVLGADGGPLPEMLLPAKLGLGGPMGSGQQWWSWIHIDDLVQLFDFLLRATAVEGPVNGTAPHPVPQKEFARCLGRTLGRPAFMPLPGFVARLLLGEFASELLLRGQRVMPAAAEQAGFEYQFAQLEPALRDLLAAS